MANVIYPKYKEALLAGATNTSLTAGTVKVALVDTASYTYTAAHEFYSSVSGVVGTPVALSGKSVTDGVFNAANATLTTVSGATAEALVVYIDTGTAGTSRLVAYIDTASGLPVTPNGGDININWDTGPNKIFKL